jgi:hypothetical protein
MAFATLRFSGDRLDPDRITAILGVEPRRAYRKGERYLAGPRAGYVTGRTGVWVLATDSVVNSAKLSRHLEYLVGLIHGPEREERLRQLHELMSRDGVKADVSCFWRGGPSPGTDRFRRSNPQVPPAARRYRNGFRGGQGLIPLPRSMASAYASVENELFYRDDTMMRFSHEKNARKSSRHSNRAAPVSSPRAFTQQTSEQA